MADEIKTLTDATWDADVLASPEPVLVDFWAEWCGPCRRLAPTVDALASDYDRRVTVAKMNVDENPEVPGKFGIRGIPTLLLFKNGEVAATKVGALSKGQLKEFLNANLA